MTDAQKQGSWGINRSHSGPPPKRWHKPMLAYQFATNDKVYEGVSFEKDTTKIGDTIFVLYLKMLPNINRPRNILSV